MMKRLPFFRSLMLLAAAAALVACGDSPEEPTGSGGGGGTTTASTTTASTGGGGSGGDGGAGGTGAEGGGGQGGTGGGQVCEPGSQLDCYDGPAATLDVGPCKGGKQTCTADGLGYGLCEGQELPQEEDCTTEADDDCDGEANQASAGCVCFPGDAMDCYDGPRGTLGNGLCVGGTSTCAADGLSWGACVGQVVPAPETCDTPGDDDCDGATNEDGAGCACVPGAVSSCYSGPPTTLGVGACKGGMQVCNDQGTGFGPCTGEITPAAETCNTPVDDDCDGMTNEGGVGCVCVPNASDACYTGPAGTLGVGICAAGVAVCNDQGTAYATLCTGDVTPATETCNTPVDDDCDGMTNESGAGCVCLPNSTQACYTGPAGTSGVGVCAPGMQTCNAQGTAYGACMGQVQPGTESCATPGDEDCDGAANEDCPAVTYSVDVQPIFQMYCGSCHTGGGSGGHNIGISYADTQLPSYYCPGMTKGQCALVRIQDGSMPLGGGPSPNVSEQATIQAWIAGGMLP